MERKIYKELLEWKRVGRGRLALMIEGARRVGKSYIVRQFAEQEYKSCIIIDFNHIDESVKTAFRLYSNNFDMLFQVLSLHFDVQLYERESLIVFDEVQQFPEARALIKYLVADGRYDYIETGSLVSIHRNVKDILIPSEEYSLKMFPMDFEEFLWALGQKLMADFISNCCEKRTPLNIIHRKAMEYLRLYMIVGGMPQVVQCYVDEKDFRRVEAEKQSIIALYRNDIRKYATGAEMRVAALFESIPSQLLLHERRFCLTDVDPKARYRDYESSFYWLQDSGIVNVCFNTFAPNIGLGMNTERTTLKCYLCDTGLLVSMAFDENGKMPPEVYERILHGKLEANMGMILENLVAQMLRAGGHKLYFFTRSDREDSSSDMEIDFLIAKHTISSRKNIVALEVKSSSRYKTSSLDKCLAKYSESISEGLILHTSDLATRGQYVCMPLYMASFL